MLSKLLLKYRTEKGAEFSSHLLLYRINYFFIYLSLDNFVGESGFISISSSFSSLFQALTIYQKSGYKVPHWVWWWMCCSGSGHTFWQKIQNYITIFVKSKLIT